jgi:hypothetical protein
VIVVQVMCAILAKAGPNRARLLRDLYRDQRSEQLKIIKILEKVAPHAAGLVFFFVHV